MNQLDLSKFFTTKAQANDFATRLSFISESVYQSNFNLENTLLEQLGIEKKDLFLTVLRDNQVDTHSPTALKAFLTKLQDDITTMPSISLTIAFEPTEKTLLGLSAWFFANYKRQAIFQITVDKDLIAGTTIRYNGKYVNYAVKPKFDQLLSAFNEGLAHPRPATAVAQTVPAPAVPAPQPPAAPSMPAAPTTASPAPAVLPPVPTATVAPAPSPIDVPAAAPVTPPTPTPAPMHVAPPAPTQHVENISVGR